jgi:gliding motility-associated-like protein
MKRLSMLLAWAVALFMNCGVFAQDQIYNICPGEFVQIKASDGSFGYQWDAEPTLTSVTLQNPIAMPGVTTTYTVRSKVTDGANLVTNGDFEQGNTGFTSEYRHFVSGMPQLEQGFYAVADNPRLYNTSGFSACKDHTGGLAGKMLIADGASNSNAVPVGAKLWSQPINVEPNTDYAFSSWITNISNGSPSSLRFSINGTSIGTPVLSLPGTCSWQQFYVMWNSGNATTAIISISEGTGSGGGNDFAIDDISFNKVREIVETVQVIVGRPTETPVITGDNSLCLSSTIDLEGSIGGGKWISSDPTVATINSTTGIITPKKLGKTNITYTLGATSCGIAASDPFEVTVTASATVPTITGANSVCLLNSVNLTGSVSGGNWTSSNLSVATIDAGGKITPVSLGKTNITYSKSGLCGSATSLPFEITVSPSPATPVITGVNFLCLTSSINLSSSGTGGTWASSNTAVATIDATGKVTALTTGTTNIIYSITSACGNMESLPFEVTITATPTVPVITGDHSLCVSNSINLTGSIAGGTWTSSAPSVATIDALGEITSVSAGKTNITYTLNSTCGNVTSLPFEVTVNTLPQLELITGSANLNLGQQSPLTINLPGGTWVSADITVVEIASDGTVKGLKGGESEITYTLNTPCGLLVSLPFKVTVFGDDLYIPNAFTPNNDGNNDEFTVYGSSIAKIEVSIFNQWGELVYKTTDISKGWAGAYKGVEQPAGVYIYTAKLEMLDGQQIIRKGAVNLIR